MWKRSIWASLISQLVKNSPSMWETPVRFLDWEDPWRRDRLPTPILGFPPGSAGKESACNVGDLGSIPGLGKIPREGKGYLLQYSGLKHSMDCLIHGVTKSQTLLNDFHFQYLVRSIHFYVLLTCYIRRSKVPYGEPHVARNWDQQTNNPGRTEPCQPPCEWAWKQIISSSRHQVQPALWEMVNDSFEFHRQQGKLKNGKRNKLF